MSKKFGRNQKRKLKEQLQESNQQALNLRGELSYTRRELRVAEAQDHNSFITISDYVDRDSNGNSSIIQARLRLEEIRFNIAVDHREMVLSKEGVGGVVGRSYHSVRSALEESLGQDLFTKISKTIVDIHAKHCRSHI